MEHITSVDAIQIIEKIRSNKWIIWTKLATLNEIRSILQFIAKVAPHHLKLNTNQSMVLPSIVKGKSRKRPFYLRTSLNSAEIMRDDGDIAWRATGRKHAPDTFDIVAFQQFLESSGYIGKENYDKEDVIPYEMILHVIKYLDLNS